MNVKDNWRLRKSKFFITKVTYIFFLVYVFDIVFTLKMIIFSVSCYNNSYILSNAKLNYLLFIKITFEFYAQKISFISIFNKIFY